MRRTVCRVLAASLVSVQLAGQAAAQPQCTAEAEREMFELAALKSQTMILATGCNSAAQYNAFVNRYKPVLAQNEQALDTWFKRQYGSRAQRERDSFVTNMANAQAERGLKQGTDFCPRNAALFAELMSLPSQEALADYAAGKDLIPATLTTCPAPAPPAKSARSRSARR